MWSTVENRRTGPVGDRPRELLIEKKTGIHKRRQREKRESETNCVRGRQGWKRNPGLTGNRNARARGGDLGGSLPGPCAALARRAHHLVAAPKQQAFFLSVSVSLSLSFFFSCLGVHCAQVSDTILPCFLPKDHTLIILHAFFVKRKQPFGFGLLAVP